MNLKEEILKALDNRPIKDYFYFNSIPYSIDESFDAEILSVSCVHFVNAKYYEYLNNREESINKYEKYIGYIEELNLVSIDPIINKLSKINTHNTINRTDKIYMHNLKKSFRYDYIDWDDLDWLMSLLRYFYILSIENIRYLRLEIKLHEIEQDVKEKKFLNVKNIKRKDILINRIKPKYTLDQFTDKLLKNIEERKKVVINDKEEKEEKKENIKKKREKDEINDERHNMRGNTDNVG